MRADGEQLVRQQYQPPPAMLRMAWWTDSPGQRSSWTASGRSSNSLSRNALMTHVVLARKFLRRAVHRASLACLTAGHQHERRTTMPKIHITITQDDI
jgi:hypothetical protein